jgi:hypothetical protein
MTVMAWNMLKTNHMCATAAAVAAAAAATETPFTLAPIIRSLTPSWHKTCSDSFRTCVLLLLPLLLLLLLQPSQRHLSASRPSCGH